MVTDQSGITNGLLNYVRIYVHKTMIGNVMFAKYETQHTQCTL